ncbi:MAG: hypothetical protein A2527_05805 [Candidatus Lambdaproteobacteria bacterium RIFOXYD2_FULL_50_16]|uniref:Uncharacterized protein n=1 Tax=Candidatus Lambdaproteobacteria bacterium RIFOXYD2_FULL_50_16 TaxID=1817772 RepID=A0A1F6G9C1_9PROT|nr:MAG: hypothetical protein A2527_05805 [Candidatus Lambdaproteobacteria bacterium RIFOXYD2_FULL_50_16]
MLSGKYLICTFKKGRAFPHFLKPTEPNLELAEALASLFKECLGLTREAAETELKEAVEGNPKVVEGMIKILLDHALFERPDLNQPEERRAQLFDLSAQYWAQEASRQPRLEGHRDKIVAKGQWVGPQEGQEATNWLFGDLPSNQVMTGFDSLTGLELLHRFNLEQVQGLLLKARRLTLTTQGAQNFGQLMQMMKFFGLLFSASEKGPQLILTIDGPGAVLENPKSYGLELANFFPAVLLLEGPWLLEAEIANADRAGAFVFLLDHQHGYHSPYPKRQSWAQDRLEMVVNRFNQQYASPYKAQASSLLHRLKHNRYLLPDIEITGHGPNKIQVQFLRYLKEDKVRWLMEIKDQLPPHYYFMVKGSRAKETDLLKAMGGRLRLYASEITAPMLKSLLE